MSFQLKAVQPDQLLTLWELIRELAAYEHVEHLVHATVQDLRTALSGPHPRIFADIATWAGEVVGCAVTYETFSTFLGQPKLYIEDLYVRPGYRGNGIGKAIISTLALRCIENGYASLQWSVLDWNQPSIDFYRKVGADISSNRLNCTMTGVALHELSALRQNSNRAA